MSQPDGSASPDLETAFTFIFKETYRKTLAYALRRVHEPADAHDVVSETYMVAWRRFDELFDVDEPQAWLYSVAYRVLSNQRRSQARRADLTKRAENHAAVSGSRNLDPAQTAEQRGDIALVTRAMATLPPRDQEVLRLAAFEELDHHEIAQVTGIRKPLVRSVLYRARRRLDQALVEAEARLHSETGHTDGGDTDHLSPPRFPDE